MTGPPTASSQATAGAPEREEDEKLELARAAEALRFRHLQQLDENGKIPPNALADALAHVEAMEARAGRVAQQASGIIPQSAGVTRGSWEWLGPGNIGGRIRSILIHPTTPTTMWVGSVSGGIFKTTNGGASWTHLDDFLPSLSVSSLVSHPSAPNTIYAGTGESTSGHGSQGAGVFKSTDGGASWSQLASTSGPNWQYVNRLSMHPAQPNTLLAATTTGLYRTVDGGATWTLELQEGWPFASFGDVDFDPVTGGSAITGNSSSGRAWYSPDGGDTWQLATGIPFAGRIEVAHARSNPSVTYASLDAAGGQIYRSTDGGRTYAFAGPVVDVNYLCASWGCQGWYDSALWVSPSNPNHVIVGGIYLYSSTNGGASLTQISNFPPTSPHVDQHVIVSSPSYPADPAAYFGNDGGIYKAPNVSIATMSSGWQELNNNLGITQFYGAAGHAASGLIIGGTQDNGTLRFNGATETWNEIFGGDGGIAAIDPTDPNYLYGEIQYGGVFRSTNRGATAQFIAGCSSAFPLVDSCISQANFIPPLVLDPNDNLRLLFGGASLWRTSNVRAATPAWSVIKPATSPVVHISAIAVASGNADLVYVGHNNGDIYRSTNATSPAPTWSLVSLSTMPKRMVLGLTIDPHNSNVVYAMFGGFSPDNVWRLSDGNTNWTDRTGAGATGLPAVPARSLVVNRVNASWLYAGTELGVFTSEDGGSTWSLPETGPARVPVDQLFFMGDFLVASTYGRGVWRADLNRPTTVPGAPDSVTVVAGSGHATVSWAPPVSDGGRQITGYVVTPYIGAAAQSPVEVGPVPSTTISGLTNGTIYTFRVRAKNALGTGAESASSNAVLIGTVPEAPTGVAGTAGNALATVSWTPPASNGGIAITNYVVTPYVGTTPLSSTQVGNVSSTTISGLTNGTTYTFRVQAKNALGNGAESASSNAVTPATLPGAPTGLGASAGNAQATVSWSPPASNGGSAITGYVVTPFVGALALPPMQVGNLTQALLTGLSNGTAYTFTVKGRNAVGEGPQSAPSNAVTPSQPVFTPPPPASRVTICHQTKSKQKPYATVKVAASALAGERRRGATVGPCVFASVGPGRRIALIRQGSKVKTLNAGQLYSIVVTDRTSTDNFHLYGKKVEKKTGVAFRGTVRWKVTFAAGRYRFRSDPHASLRGSFTVRRGGST